MKSVSSKILVIVLILFLALLYHYQNLNEFPSHIHAWAQSDRYALSLGFLDNGLNFFKPQTFVYNHQFPSNWSKASEYSITAVDFPIHDFVPALMMKITASDEPWVFRLYVLIYSLFGLFFLFKISYSISTNYYKSIFVVVFAATSPVFVYYQNGFLPTIPSLSNTIIGLYFYIKHLDDNKQRSFIAGIFFLTLASLARTTFIIPFIAVLCVELIRMIKKETRVAAKIAVITISFFLLGFYQLYNGYLREKYGSVFLNHFLPPNNWDDFLYILTKVYTNWGQQYFTTAHYLIFPLLVLTSIIFLSTIYTKKNSKILSPFIFSVSLYLLLSNLNLFIPQLNDSLSNLMIELNKETFEKEVLKGKSPILVDFWASWCGPCRQSFPWMNAIQEKYRSQGFEVIAVNLDANHEDAQKFLAATPAGFTVAFDSRGQTPRQYGVKGMPTSYLIGRDGKILSRHTGFNAADRDELEKMIRTSLEERQ